MSRERISYPPKITTPRTAKVLERGRLYRQLDEARESASLIWLSAPGGSGKTTLLASYLQARKLKSAWYQIDEGDADPATFFHYMGLAGSKLSPRRKKTLPIFTPEYMPGLSTFTLRYFEEMAERLGKQGMLVLDNFQLLDKQSFLYSLLPFMVESLHPGQTVVVISRHQPPEALAGLRAKQILQEISWEQLRFNESEWTAAYACLGGASMEAENLKQLHKRADGWIAGLVLNQLHGDVEGQDLAQQSFAFFAVEAFEHFDNELQQVLLTVALLPHISAPAAEALCELPNASRLLARLARSNLFVVRQEAEYYTLHPLFQEFLQHRLQEQYNEHELRSLQQRSAQVLCDSGDALAALPLYVATQSWQQLRDLLHQHAEELMQEGRYALLSEGIAALPTAWVEQDAALQCYLGTIAGMQNFDKALAHYRSAAELAKQNNAPGLTLQALVQGAQLISQTMQKLEELKEMLDLLVEKAPSISEQSQISEATLTATLLTCYLINDHDRALTHYWIRVAEAQLENSDDAMDIIELASALLFIYSNDGNSRKIEWAISRIEPLLDSKQLPPHLRLLNYSKVMWAWPCSRDIRAGVDKISELISYGEQSGVLILSGMYGTLKAKSLIFLKDEQVFQPLMESINIQLPPDPLYSSVYNSLLGQKKLWSGDYKAALDDINLALEQCGADGPFGWRNVLLIMQAELLWRLEDVEQARAVVNNTLNLLEGYPNSSAIFALLLLKAAIAHEQSEPDKALSCMEQAWALAKENHLLFFVHWSPLLMQWACEYALTHRVQMSYVLKVIDYNRDRLVLPDYTVMDWPWPVRITTLGRFHLEFDGGKTLKESKQNQRPLQLLMLLIEHSGAADNQVIHDALYPEQSEEKRTSLLRTHLHRLRTLLGHDEAVLRENERLRLNPKLCWIDSDAFEALLKQKSTQARKQALALYAGEYLSHADTDDITLLAKREKYRADYLRAALEEMTALDTEQAIAWCHEVLHIEPFSEVVYQELMKRYHQSGRDDLARATYEQCHRTLLSGLGIEPMDETRRIAGMATT